LHWSHVPTPIVIVADCLVVSGFVMVFFVFKENTYTSATIELADVQEVISTGPNAIVRHPMYAGALLLFSVTPIALGSWWGLPFVFPMFAVIILRLLDEEKFLLQNLVGDEEYCRRVRYRLIPRIW
jgi:protein-S-isoprenylcysteine O-methyltransferase Ste14